MLSSTGRAEQAEQRHRDCLKDLSEDGSAFRVPWRKENPS